MDSDVLSKGKHRVCAHCTVYSMCSVHSLLDSSGVAPNECLTTTEFTTRGAESTFSAPLAEVKPRRWRVVRVYHLKLNDSIWSGKLFDDDTFLSA